MHTLDTGGSTSLGLAGALMRAWICGDANRVRAELSRTLECVGAMKGGVEGEHQILLRAIASRLQRCRSLFAPRKEDPGLDLCIDLLAHLVSREAIELRLS